MVMKVKSTHPESQGPFVLIEDADFNPDVHEKYVESKASAKAAAAAAAETTDDATGKGAGAKHGKK